MSEIEHTRTLGKAHQYVNTKILLLAGIINRSPKITTADAGDVLLRIEYSADSHEPVTYYCGSGIKNVTPHDFGRIYNFRK
jgi:hypothetical protein